MRTDFNQGMSANSKVPCWEREYRLTPVTKDFVEGKLKSLGKHEIKPWKTHGLRN